MVDRLVRGAISLIRPAGLAAAVCFVSALACSYFVRGVVGARVTPCDRASGQAPVVLALPELSRSPLNPRFKPEGCVVVSGFWMRAKSAEVEMRVVSDGAASLSVDGNLVAEREARGSGRMGSGRVRLGAGAHRFEMRFEPEGLAQLRGVVVDEHGAANLDPTFLRPPSRSEYLAERSSRLLVRLAAAFLAMALVALLLSPGAWRPALAIVGFAALRRLEALIGRFGGDLPGVVARNLVFLANALRPDTWTWEKEIVPYAGGDPVRYIEFAREMSGFFDAHVREPLFVAWSRLFIVDLGFGDLGISIASGIASCALVAATFLFARARFGPAVAVIAALLLAADPAVIGLSVEGWRDGAFAASFVLALWAVERARLDPSRAKAALAGVALGASCLLRLSALSYVAPAFLDLALFGCAPRQRRFAAAGWATAGATLLAGPYLVSCAIAYGDPLFAVNYHLRYYRPGGAAPGEPATSAVSAYIFSLQDPWGRADTLFEGLTSYPFLSKWKGLELWFGSATELIAWASLFGLIGWVFSPAGRRLLLLTACALVPFSFTWGVPGGSEYRFTLLAYPIYLAAAGWFVTRGVALRRGTTSLSDVLGLSARALAVSALVFCLGVALRHAGSTADGRAAREFTVGGGPRDLLSASGFGMPRLGPEGFVRTSIDAPRVLTVRLRPERPWLLTLRWNGSQAGQILEDGRVIDELPKAPGSDPVERTMRLPASTRENRRFEIASPGTFDFMSARFSPEPSSMTGVRPVPQEP